MRSSPRRRRFAPSRRKILGVRTWRSTTSRASARSSSRASAATPTRSTGRKTDAGYETSYLTKHPGHYLTGDAGFKDADGYVYIMSRVDDIINVAGHRLSTGAMEEVLAAHPDVAECAVVGVADEIKGEVPVGFVVTKAGV